MSNLLGHSRAKWRKRGYHVFSGETVMKRGKLTVRQDLFGFADLVAVPSMELLTTSVGLFPKVVFIQVTSRSNMAARKKKILVQGVTGRGQWEVPIWDVARALVLTGCEVLVEGWDKKDGRWRSKEVWLP